MHYPAPSPHHHHHRPDPNTMLSLSLKLSLNCLAAQQQQNFEAQSKYLDFADKLCVLWFIHYMYKDKHTHLVSWQGDYAGHLPGERVHRGPVVREHWSRSSSFRLSHNIYLKPKENHCWPSKSSTIVVLISGFQQPKRCCFLTCAWTFW